MQRSILLQICPTVSKKTVLSNALSVATLEFNRLWDDRDFCLKFMDFHKKVYLDCKRRTSFHSNIVCDIERSVWRSKGKSKGITLKFNVTKDVSKFFKTKSFPFVELAVYPKHRIAVPIIKNSNYQRYSDLLKSGWKCKTYGLTSKLEIVAYLSKGEVELHPKRNVLGVDVNSKCFAVSVLSPEGKVLHQEYLGKDIWERRKKIFERKSILRSYADKGSSYANKALRKTKQNEHNFVKNRIGEIVRNIIDTAIDFDADISIEDLKKFSSKGKNFNREVMRIPFLTFKKNLAQRCFGKNITLNIVDSWHTSKFCNHCGAVGKGHSSTNYALFRCKECGVEVNSDRNASLNIALKSLLERRVHNLNHSAFFQISNRRVPVNGLMRSDETVLS